MISATGIDGLAVARKSLNDFTFGDETKNRLPACHHQSAINPRAQPVCGPLNAGVRGSIVATSVPFCLRIVSMFIAASLSWLLPKVTSAI
jgi:hypothetical protein